MNPPLTFSTLNLSTAPQSHKEVWKEFDKRSLEFLEKAQRGANLRGEHDLIIDALAGYEGRLSCCQASDTRARKRAAMRIYEQMAKIMTADRSVHFAFVTALDKRLDASDEDTEIHLGKLFDDIMPVLKCIGPNAIAMAEMQPFANLKHPKGGKRIAVHTHSLVWGHGPLQIQATQGQWGDKFQGISRRVPGLVIDRVQPTLLDLARVVRYPLKAPCRCKTRYYNPNTGHENLHESEKGDRYIRYNRLLEILSHINLRDLFRGMGDGERIVLETGIKMRKWAQKSSVPLIGADEIGPYWSSIRGKSSDQKRFQPPKIIL